MRHLTTEHTTFRNSVGTIEFNRVYSSANPEVSSLLSFTITKTSCCRDSNGSHTFIHNHVSNSTNSAGLTPIFLWVYIFTMQHSRPGVTAEFLGWGWSTTDCLMLWYAWTCPLLTRTLWGPPGACAAVDQCVASKALSLHEPCPPCWKEMY